jgi:hypothetical protein
LQVDDGLIPRGGVSRKRDRLVRLVHESGGLLIAPECVILGHEETLEFLDALAFE